MITKAEIDRLIAEGEGVRIEFKEGQNGVPDSFYDSVVSFLNKEGGIIVLGVADNGTVLGLEEGNLMRLKQDIVTALNNPDVVNPPYALPVREAKYDENILLYVRVPVSSLVHKHAGIIYDRENDSDFRVTDERQIGDIYFRKRQNFSETQIFPELRMSDLDERIFDKVRKLIAAVNSTHPWLTATTERILRDVNFYRKDFTTGEEGLTLAAALVFGKDETIGNLLPAYKLDVMVRRENVDRWDDRLPPLRTNLVDTYIDVLKFVKDQWPEKFFTEGEQRKDLREIIFRELVANVIIHREYNTALASEIIIYNDRVEAKNPNKPRFSGPLDVETFNAEPKNPNIRKFFSELNWADEIGSGVKNINKYLNYYTPGAHPTFIEDDPFVTIVPMAVERIGIRDDMFIGIARLSKEQLGERRLSLLKNLPLSLELKEIKDDDLLAIELVKLWEKKSGELHKIRFLISSKIEIDKLKKVGSWEKKSVELLKKRGVVLLSTLLLSLDPISLEELASVLGYKSKERYREDYVKPLKDNHLIDYTIPDTPNDPAQAYVITQRGKDFLGGHRI
ncbi:RNA-binding domain-containing protein [Maribellus sediminis]|uniref:RNA-binding domain-containing protein n=1 Tax=Maribellus sediminis TaxID=2696285 RepID=UPI0014312BDB|nr:RNA-binding domain-containing protein [Maribellus sediminis]